MVNTKLPTQSASLDEQDPLITGFFAQEELNPAPPPAAEIQPARVYNVSEGDKAKNLRYVSYGLFAASAVAGLGGGKLVAEGGKVLMKKTAEETAKASARTAVTKGTALIATSTTFAGAGFFTRKKAKEAQQELVAAHNAANN